jgi:succinyl-CoA synthetase beta subunit
VIKAQVHAGGRGKAGGVKVVKSKEEAAEVANELIGKIWSLIKQMQMANQ